MDEKTKENKRISYIWYGLLLAVILAAGRAAMAVYNNVSVDIAYAVWFADLFRYATDVLNGAKIALGYGAIAYATHRISKSAGTVTMLMFMGGLVLENGARFLIDYFSSGLEYYGIAFTLVVLLLRFLYEGAFAFAAWLIARLFLKRSVSRSDTEKPSFCSAENSARVSILVFMGAQVIGEIVYLIQHLLLYGEITQQELAVCIGSFLSIIVMFGGIPLLLNEAVFPFMRRITYENKEKV